MPLTVDKLVMSDIVGRINYMKWLEGTNQILKYQHYYRVEA